MKLSDYIRALQHVLEKEGDLQVLEERRVWYDSYSFFPDNIRVDRHVVPVTRYHCPDQEKHVWQHTGYTEGEHYSKDRKDFKAFVIGIGE